MKKGDLFRRLLQIVIVLFGISFITFALTYIAPGDPVRAMYAASGTIPREEILEQTREKMGLNEPFFTQYLSWLTDCLRGDFGTSYMYHRPVAELILERLGPTLRLAFFSLALMLIVAVPLGILSATHKGRPADFIIRVGTFFGVSLPNFWVGLMLLYVFSVRLGVLPVVSDGQGFRKMILPAVTLAFAMAGKYTRQVRTAFLGELNQDYVTGARCRGISERMILWRHGAGKSGGGCDYVHGLSADSGICTVDCADLYGAQSAGGFVVPFSGSGHIGKSIGKVNKSNGWGFMFRRARRKERDR